VSYEDNEADVREDEALERALEFAADPLAGRRGPGPEGPEGETLTRIYVELLGLLPHELEPVESSPAERAALLALVGSVAGAAENGHPALERPAEARELAAPSAVSSLEAPVAARPEHAPPPARPSKGSGRWALPLAAVFLVALLGVSGWLTFELQNQKAAVARLERELHFAQEQSANLAAMRTQMKEMDRRLELVTSPASESCPLRPAGEQPMAPGASGVLFVGPNHQHWYLALYGLDSPPPGRTYQLWFVVGGRPVSVATFQGKRGSKIEFASDTMPHDTKAVAVTLEPAGGMPQPTGPQVLYGDQMTPLG